MALVAFPSARPPAGRDQPHRLVAVGAAALVTVLSVGGALGLVPGVSAQQPATAAAGGQPAGTADPSPVTDADRAEDDGWLTVDEGPAPGASASDPSDSAGSSDSGYDDYSAVPAGSGAGKRIVYDISEQHTWLVTRAGKVLRHYPVSGGRDESLLDPGRYAVYSKSRHAVSFNLRETMNYMVRFSHGDSAPIGFHDVPALPSGGLVQTRDELGAPRSAGCIRQWITDARALWKFSELGTPVIVKA